MKLMVQHLVDNLEFFKEDIHWKDEHYNWCHDFLTQQDQRVLFFWNDFKDFTLKVSNVAAPRFYGKSKFCITFNLEILLVY